MFSFNINIVTKTFFPKICINAFFIISYLQLFIKSIFFDYYIQRKVIVKLRNQHFELIYTNIKLFPYRATSCSNSAIKNVFFESMLHLISIHVSSFFVYLDGIHGPS